MARSARIDKFFKRKAASDAKVKQTTLLLSMLFLQYFSRKLVFPNKISY
jgi:hypothetical protein